MQKQLAYVLTLTRVLPQYRELTAGSALFWPKSWLKCSGVAFQWGHCCSYILLLQKKDAFCGFRRIDHTCIKPNAFLWSPQPSLSTVPVCDSWKIIPAISHSWINTLAVAKFGKLDLVFFHVFQIFFCNLLCHCLRSQWRKVLPRAGFSVPKENNIWESQKKSTLLPGSNLLVHSHHQQEKSKAKHPSIASITVYLACS